MKIWYVSANNYWFSASLHLEKVPIGLYYIERIVTWACSITPDIPLPKIKFKVKDKSNWEYMDSNDGWTTLQDWFGDTQNLFHSYVCTPIHNFVWKHTKVIHIDLPYHFLKEKFPVEFERDLETEWDDEDREFRVRAEILATYSDKQFRDVYKTLNYEYKNETLK